VGLLQIFLVYKASAMHEQVPPVFQGVEFV
jgi:hypothetical protein